VRRLASSTLTWDTEKAYKESRLDGTRSVTHVVCLPVILLSTPIAGPDANNHFAAPSTSFLAPTSPVSSLSCKGRRWFASFHCTYKAARDAVAMNAVNHLLRSPKTSSPMCICMHISHSPFWPWNTPSRHREMKRLLTDP
jgi:hypothetical protein